MAGAHVFANKVYPEHLVYGSSTFCTPPPLVFNCATFSRWRLIQQPEQLDGLAAALDPRGAREGGLAAALNRLSPSLKRAMPSSPLTIDLRGASPSGPLCPGAGPLQQQQQQQLACQLRCVRPQASLFPASAEVKPPVRMCFPRAAAHCFCWLEVPGSEDRHRVFRCAMMCSACREGVLTSVAWLVLLSHGHSAQLVQDAYS
eukprot:scaffold23342_cov22-Tisochrysis_lutea.AAC.1